MRFVCNDSIITIYPIRETHLAKYTFRVPQNRSTIQRPCWTNIFSSAAIRM